eukprot:1598357-Amphidinium_carterae.1
MSTNVTRLGVTSCAGIGESGSDGERAKGSVQAMRRDLSAQDLGSGVPGGATGLSERKGTLTRLDGGGSGTGASWEAGTGPALEPGPGELGLGGRGSPVPQWTIAALAASRRTRSSGRRSRPCSATHQVSACAGVSLGALCHGGFPVRSRHCHIREPGGQYEANTVVVHLLDQQELQCVEVQDGQLPPVGGALSMRAASTAGPAAGDVGREARCPFEVGSVHRAPSREDQPRAPRQHPHSQGGRCQWDVTRKRAQ